MFSIEHFFIWLRILLVCLFVAVLGILPGPILVREAYEAAEQARAIHMPEAAAAELKHLVEMQPWRSEVWEEMGFDLLAAEKYTAAIEAFREARNQGRLTPAGQMAFGEAYQKAGDPASARLEWRRMIQQGRLAPIAYEDIYQLQKSSGDLSGAMETLQAWSILEPKHANLLYQKGLVQLSLHPGDGLPEELVASSRLDISYAAKVDSLRRAASLCLLSKDKAYQALLVGRALGNLGDWDLAKTNFESAVQLSPDYAEAWAFLSEAKQQLHLNGYNELFKAAKLKPDSGVVQVLFSIYWSRQGRPALAMDYLRAMISKEPDQAIWQIEAGNTAASSGNLIEALAYFQKAVQVEPQNGLTWQALARFCVDYMVDIESIGLPAVRKALQLSPEDPDALDLMGVTLLKLDDLVSAERFLQRALIVNSSYASAHLHLGQLYIQWDRQDQALEHLKAAERLAGDSSIGTIARRLKTQHFPGD